MMFFLNGTVPVTKTTDHNFGDFAIRIENIDSPDGWIYGWAFTGPQGENGPLPGFPVTTKDTTLHGYYKFYPQNGDPMVIGAMMFEARTVVGTGYFVNYSTVDSYTPFTAPINYNDGYTGTPDSATVILLSFAGGQSPLGNSVLYVDDLSFDELITSVSEQKAKNSLFRLYPNPAINTVCLDVSSDRDESVEIQIYTLTGMLMKSETVKQNQQKINISGLSNGVYLVSLRCRDWSEIQKLIIKK
jgi:hypothetical protein